MKNSGVKLTLTLFFISFFSVSFAQQHTKPSLKDSVDSAFDLSDYIIHANGFIPIPIIITEPAFGGFGGGLVPIFLKRRPPYIDSIKGTIKVTPVAPDITGAAVLYTLNNSWMVGGFRSGTLIKRRIKYVIGGGYADINMSYYKTVDDLGDKEFKFNIKTPTIFLQSIKRIGYSNWYAGIKYLFLKTNVKYVGDSVALPTTWVTQDEYSSVVSQLGAVIELDKQG